MEASRATLRCATSGVPSADARIGPKPLRVTKRSLRREGQSSGSGALLKSGPRRHKIAAVLAAKEETTPVFPLAAFVLANLTENPHRGFRLPTAALHPSRTLANSNTAFGLRVFAHDFCRRSRSTGKLRDNETGLDYFGARYFSGAMGRFTSTDPISGTLLHLINPQRWNMYAYAVNNPLAFTDPDGRDAIAVKFGNGATGKKKEDPEKDKKPPHPRHLIPRGNGDADDN